MKNNVILLMFKQTYFRTLYSVILDLRISIVHISHVTPFVESERYGNVSRFAYED